MKIGDIVTYMDKDDAYYYTGVVMEIKNDIITIQGIDHNQCDIPQCNVIIANSNDMLEELRCLYGFYH